MNNSSVIVLAKNPVFQDRSKHIDTIFHYWWDCIANEEVEVKYVKTQDQVVDIFTKPLKYDFFYQNKKCVESYKQINFKGGCWK